MITKRGNIFTLSNPFFQDKVYIVYNKCIMVYLPNSIPWSINFNTLSICVGNELTMSYNKKHRNHFVYLMFFNYINVGTLIPFLVRRFTLPQCKGNISHVVTFEGLF